MTLENIRWTILKYVMAHDGFTIPQIAELTGYSMTTISKHVDAMVTEGLIQITDLEKSGRKGRRASIYTARPEYKYYLGIDIKNYGLEIGLMDFAMGMVQIESHPDYVFENSYNNLDTVCRMVQEFIDSLPISRDKIAGANFNFGGRVDSKSGTSASLFNFEDTRDTPLAELLGERIGLRALIENDTKAMAYGEYVSYGCQWPNVLFVNVGWGLGLGIIINGELYHGRNGYSGEMGHMHAYDNNILCQCGKKGCIETEVSGQALQRKIVAHIRSGEASILSGKVRSGGRITMEDIIEATEREDPLCIENVSRMANELGKHLAGMINIFNPDCIIIGGKLASTSSYYFLQQVSVAIRHYSLKLMSRNVPVLTSKLGESSGVIGACMMAHDRIIFGDCLQVHKSFRKLRSETKYTH